MDTNIALMATGYLLTRIGVLIAFGYIVYRVLRPSPSTARVESRSNYARERYEATRLDR